MTTDFQRINVPRVGKIVDALSLIDTSARSQRVARGDVRAILEPIYRKLGVTFAEAPLRPVEENTAPGEITTHDGNTIVILKACLRRSAPDQVRAALEWCIKHNAG